MISHVIHYGVPNTPELLRDHLSHCGFKVSAKRAARLALLYKAMLKEPIQWTDPSHFFGNPFSIELPEYEHLGIRAVQRDLKCLVESGLVFAFQREPTLMEMAQSEGIV